MGCPEASTGAAKANDEGFEQYKRGRGAELATFPRSRRTFQMVYTVVNNDQHGPGDVCVA